MRKTNVLSAFATYYCSCHSEPPSTPLRTGFGFAQDKLREESALHAQAKLPYLRPFATLRVTGWSAIALYSLMLIFLTAPVQALDEDMPTHHDHHAVVGEEDTPPEEHEGHMEGHHHYRAPVLSPDEDKAYSELNHYIAGVFVLFAGGLALLVAPANPRFSWARYGWPGLFVCMGVFLFIRHDPESWPWGSLSLWEAMEDPQVLQHVLFTFIVLGIGVIEWLRSRGTLTHPVWGLIFPVLAISAAGMLFLHKHGSGPVADKIYRHHSIMAFAGIAAMLAKVLDDSRLLKSRIGAYLWPGLMMFIGVMLLIYSE